MALHPDFFQHAFLAIFLAVFHDDFGDVVAVAADIDVGIFRRLVAVGVDVQIVGLERRLGLRDLGTMLPFTVLDGPGGRPVGMTTYMNIDAAGPRVEIGSTWYAKRVQRSAVNTQCKLLLLTHAFEKLDCIAVEFRTHWHNRQSRAAIAALGAKQDGVLRSHQLMDDGSLRDTVVYSILDIEWPAVRNNLRYRLDRHRL